MTRKKHEKARPVRPIKTRRDYESASALVKRMSGQRQDSAAELRLQSLLRELDKFDETEDDAADASGDDDYSGPSRRWSDDAPDTE
jgi:hypothetical protein